MLKIDFINALEELGFDVEVDGGQGISQDQKETMGGSAKLSFVSMTGVIQGAALSGNASQNWKISVSIAKCLKSFSTPK